MSATIDHFEMLSAEETGGVLTRLTRRAFVSGLAKTDYTAMWDALDDAGVPAALTVLTEEPNLILSRRTPHIEPGSPSKCWVDLEYVSRAECPTTTFIWRGGGSLGQFTSQSDAYGVPLSVSYTYPADYAWNTQLQSETDVAGAEISVTQPELTLVGVGIIATDYPLNIVHEWQGALNLTEWAGGPAYRWCCVDVQFEPRDLGASPNTYVFTFTMQYRFNGWQPTIYYIDPNTGRPPADLVAGVGYKTINWYSYLDYNTRFPM